MSIKFYTSPKNFIPLQNKFLATPLISNNEWRILAQDDLGGSLGVQSIPNCGSVVSVHRDDGTHRLAGRVKRVDLAKAILGHTTSNGVVVLTERQYETKQCTFRFVSELLRQVALSFSWLSTTSRSDNELS